MKILLKTNRQFLYSKSGKDFIIKWVQNFGDIKCGDSIIEFGYSNDSFLPQLEETVIKLREFYGYI